MMHSNKIFKYQNSSKVILKFKSIVLAFAAVAVLGLSSCDKEKDPPTISDTEVGEGNSKTATIGGTLHMDAKIDAPGKIDKITVDLHPESGSGDDIEAEYTSYAGQLNADFHEDLPIPSTATAGEYHFHLTVTDEEGQSKSFEADVDIQAQEADAPVISNLTVGEGNSKTASIGGELDLDAEITAPGKIDKIVVDLHPESGSGDDIEAEFTNYAGKTSADFHEHVEIPSTATAGEYHMHIKVTDQEGKTSEVDVEVDIQ